MPRLFIAELLARHEAETKYIEGKPRPKGRSKGTSDGEPDDFPA